MKNIKEECPLSSPVEQIRACFMLQDGNRVIKLCKVLVLSGLSCMVLIINHTLKRERRGSQKRDCSVLSRAQVMAQQTEKRSMCPSCGHLCWVFVSLPTHYVPLQRKKVSHRHSANCLCYILELQHIDPSLRRLHLIINSMHFFPGNLLGSQTLSCFNFCFQVKIPNNWQI